METKKKRELRFREKAKYFSTGTLGANVVGEPQGEVGPILGFEETISSGHPWPPRGAQRERDIGGNFQNIKRTYVDSLSRNSFDIANNFKGNGYGVKHSGAFSFFGLEPLDRDWMYPSVYGLSDSQLIAKGATAISNTAPTNPAANAAQFLSELKRDGLPSLPGLQALTSKKSFRQKVGEENLNWEFAFKPFIADLQDFAKAAKDSEKILKQYRRDSGKNVRRRFTFPEVVETSVEKRNYAGGLPTPSNSYLLDCLVNRSNIDYTVTTTKRSKVWFSGCFTYYLDPGEVPWVALIGSHKKLTSFLEFSLRLNSSGS